MADPCVVLIFNLLQDVNILRPIVFLAKRDLKADTRIFVTRKFQKRDRLGNWFEELKEIAETTGATIQIVNDEFHAQQQLQDLAGIMFAASETNLSAHDIVHNIFRLKPSSFVSVTIQHGFECVGFLQSRDHTMAHGQEVTFAADIVCGWCDNERLKSLLPSQRDKLIVTGPTSILQQPARMNAQKSGIICENLHSVRLNRAGDFKSEFVSFFNEYTTRLAAEGHQVVLRPHPGGQYVVKNNFPIPANVILNNHPIYKVNLSKYAYGISAPSSILIDMMLAAIPTAVWRDSNGKMDADNYFGITEVTTVQDWIDFARESRERPENFLKQQNKYLKEQRLMLDPRTAYARFVEIIKAAIWRAKVSETKALSLGDQKSRITFVANSLLPTLQLSFLKPLAPLIEKGILKIDVLTEEDMKKELLKKPSDEKIREWFINRLDSFQPGLVVFCRYSGPNAEEMTHWADRNNVPTIFHIDDDLLNIPIELGEAKHAFHNSPSRISTVRHLLDSSDKVYCSNDRLKNRLYALGAKAPLVSGTIYASGTVITESAMRPIRKIGYMASSDHSQNLEMIKPSIIKYLRQNPDVVFELFGSIPAPPEFAEFGKRVQNCLPIRSYEKFLTSFAEQEWDIGICPLVPSPFNLVKSNTKWVEYTSVGAAVIASRGTVYDDCCADGCGILADSLDEWADGLERLTRDPALRLEQVKRAQEKLRNQYSVERLREQVLSIFNEVQNENLVS